MRDPQRGLFDEPPDAPPQFTTISSGRRSGKTGGAGTGRGVDYQTHYAVLWALRLLHEYRHRPPANSPMLQTEPRLVSRDEVTRWDFSVFRPGPPQDERLMVEAKASPSKEDVIDLLSECRRAVEAGAKVTFELVHGDPARGAVGCMEALNRLMALATEAACDEAVFQNLCGLETSKPLREHLEVLGASAFTAARTLRLEHLTEHGLEREVERVLAETAAEGSRPHLRSMLYEKLVAGMKRRETFLIRGLFNEVERRGIAWFDPDACKASVGNEVVYSALAILQRCGPATLPTPVLAAAAGCETDEFERIAGDTDLLTRADADPEDGGSTWRAVAGAPSAAPPNPGEVFGRALRALITFVKNHSLSAAADDVLSSAVPLASACAEHDPAAVARAFSPLDKPLKRRGDKRDVLAMADLAIKCAERGIRDGADPQEMRRAKAKAIVCGRTWVFQRVGELEKAESCALESLRLGQDLGWTRNTAFTQKCRGRLRRVMAEQATNGAAKRKLLKESRELLEEAIAAFAACPDHGPDAPEVGDCHSLLARTELLAGNLREATERAKEARARLEAVPNHPERKDYIDLLIVEGDLSAEKFDYRGAEVKYDEAIRLAAPLNAEHSEIVARAVLARGRNILKQDREAKQDACEQFSRAAQMWSKLEDDHHVGVARWAIAELRVTLPGNLSKMLTKEVPAVRVAAVGAYEKLRQKESKATTLSLRSEGQNLPEGLAKNLVREARRTVAESAKAWGT